MTTVDLPPPTTRKDWTSDQEVRWCPGCGDYSILAQMKKALTTVGVPREKLAFVDLDPDKVMDQLPSELSGGMRKRVGIARAIALRPKYILYDEPTTGLDPVTSAVIDQLMVRMRQKLNVTGIVITHDMRSAYTVGTRIAMLYEGKVRWEGSVSEIHNTTDPVVRQFIEGRPTIDDDGVPGTPVPSV